MVCFKQKGVKSIPQGINGWVETHPYQPVLYFVRLAARDPEGAPVVP